jgi:hypothetical protein
MQTRNYEIFYLWLEEGTNIMWHRTNAHKITMQQIIPTHGATTMPLPLVIWTLLDKVACFILLPSLHVP